MKFSTEKNDEFIFWFRVSDSRHRLTFTLPSDWSIFFLSANMTTIY